MHSEWGSIGIGASQVRCSFSVRDSFIGGSVTRNMKGSLARDICDSVRDNFMRVSGRIMGTIGGILTDGIKAGLGWGETD